MQNKHTKKWLIGMVVALMIVGAAASLYSQKQKFYKGIETLNIEKALKNAKQAQASILTAEPEQRDFSKIIQENSARINGVAPAITSEKSPCSNGEITVWQYGKFAGCEKPKTAAPNAQPAPIKTGPKVTIIK